VVIGGSSKTVEIERRSRENSYVDTKNSIAAAIGG